MIGCRPTKKYLQTPYKKICVFGALGSGTIITRVSRKINGRSYLAFLRQLLRRYPKLCIITDNARWHLTAAVMQFIRRSRITLIRLPPYSPELNPIEQYWKNVKNWLGMRAWFSLPELIRQLRIAFRQNFLLPDISDY